MNTALAKRSDQTLVELHRVPDKDQFRLLRRQVHSALIKSLEHSSADWFGNTDRLRIQLHEIVDELAEQSPIAPACRQRVEQEILQEINGLGPLAPLMIDEDIADILVNAPDDIWVERNGRLERTDICFDDEQHLRRMLDRLVAAAGRHLDSNSPTVDARLADGSRLQAVVPPLTRRGAILSIRRFRSSALSTQELVAAGFCDAAVMSLLTTAVQARVNIIISGSAGAGKTTLLNALAAHIPASERIVVVEDTAELNIRHPHTVSLECRPGNMEGRGEVTMKQLLKTALRMRANRILVGEIRGGEVSDMLQAMNTGHDGGLCTVHASSTDSVSSRMETLALTSEKPLPLVVVQRMIAATEPLLLHVCRDSSGQRKLISIGEIRMGTEQPETHTLWPETAPPTLEQSALAQQIRNHNGNFNAAEYLSGAVLP